MSGAWPRSSCRPGLDFTRVIAPSAGMAQDPNLSLVRSLLSEERAQKTKLVELLVSSLVTKEASLQTAMTSQATLATARTAGSAASDMGGMMQLGAALGLLVAWPMVKKSFGLPESAGIEEVVTLARLQVAGMVEGARGEAGPVGLLPPPADDAAHSRAFLPADVVVRMKADPTFLAALGNEVQRDVELAAVLKAIR